MRLVRNSGLAALLVCLAWGAPAHALVISELLAVNDSVIADEDGDFVDWLELHNDGAEAVDVAGWYLTDNDGRPDKWGLPSLTLAPGGYLLVFASGKDRSGAGAELHTNFKLSGGGEYLALVRPDGLTVEHAYAPGFPEQRADVSYGLAADLMTERCFATPTPAAANDTSAPCGFVADIAFSVPHGLYEAAFTVELSTATSGAVIRYTTDASTPTDSNGELYTAPISVGATTLLRAVATAGGLLASPVATASYIFLDDVLVQSAADLPAEYPDKWGYSVDADYGMDPDVVDDPAYSGEIKDGLRSIATVSVVTDVGNLFGQQEGIYVHTKRRGVEWERPVSVELIIPDGEGFQVNCGLRIQGGAGRNPRVKKHAFRMLFKSEYGPTRLRYPLFEDSDVDSFNTVSLTSRYNHSWHNSSDRALYIRDTWAKDTQLDMGHPSGHSRYVHLYLNGLYWGLYRMTERPDAAFMSSYLGGDEEDWDVIKSASTVAGDREAWDLLQDLADAGLESAGNYQAVIDMLDVTNFIDYLILNIYGENSDWDWHNWIASRQRSADGKFRFFSWDAEYILENANANASGKNYRDAPTSVYSDLRKENAEFRVLFGDRVHKHLLNDGALTPGRVAARFQRRADEIYSALIGESARWGDKSYSDPFTRDEHWLVERQWLMLSYFPRRTELALEDFVGAGLYPAVAAPVLSQRGGPVPPGHQLNITAPTGTVYYTDDGSDPRMTGGGLAASAREVTGPLAVDAGVDVSARALAAGEWSALERARFTMDRGLRITEIMYNPAATDESLEFVEVANLAASPLDLTGVRFTRGVDFDMPATSLAAGQYGLVVADTAAFEAEYGSGALILGQYTGRLANGGERLRIKDAAGDTVQQVDFDDAWYGTSDGAGHSLVLFDLAGAATELDDASVWRASAAAGGSPGQADAASGTPVAPEADPASFMCYRVRENDAGTDFDGALAELSDTFESGITYKVRKVDSVCLADQATTHLEAYRIKEDRGQPRHERRRELKLSNRFGPLFIDTNKPRSLLVPTAVSVDAAVAPPMVGAHTVDHYKCYKVKMSRDRPRYFPTKAQTGFKDMLEDRDYALKRPRTFCTAVSVDGETITDAASHLLCYPAKYSKFSSRHQKRYGIYSANRFGDGRLNTKKENEFCVPTSLVAGL